MEVAFVLLAEETWRVVVVRRVGREGSVGICRIAVPCGQGGRIVARRQLSSSSTHADAGPPTVERVMFGLVYLRTLNHVLKIFKMKS